MSLSTFKFHVTTKRSYARTDIVVDLHLSWKKASGVVSCWHELFKRIMVVCDSPITDRSQFRQPGMSTITILSGQDMLTRNPGLPAPKGLDLPFNLVDQLTVLAFAFEHGQGIVMKGFDCLLVATRKWDTTSRVGFQWHFVNNKNDKINILDYVWDSQYHIWNMGE